MLIPKHIALRAKGYATWTHPDQKMEEKDTMQCIHCGAHWMVEVGSGIQRGWCTVCNGPHCGQQACCTCLPLEKMMDVIERKSRSDYYMGIE